MPQNEIIHYIIALCPKCMSHRRAPAIYKHFLNNGIKLMVRRRVVVSLALVCDCRMVSRRICPVLDVLESTVRQEDVILSLLRVSFAHLGMAKLSTCMRIAYSVTEFVVRCVTVLLQCQSYINNHEIFSFRQAQCFLLTLWS